jgi:hypothetical protein
VVLWPREQRSAKTVIMALAVDMALEELKSAGRLDSAQGSAAKSDVNNAGY